MEYELVIVYGEPMLLSDDPEAFNMALEMNLVPYDLSGKEFDEFKKIYNDRIKNDWVGTLISLEDTVDMNTASNKYVFIDRTGHKINIGEYVKLYTLFETLISK